MLKFANYLPAVCAFTALCMAACSQDDALQTTVNDNDGLKAVTVTATLPESGMTTRAAGGTDATATRCYVQVLDSEGETLGDNFSDVKEMTETTNGFTTTVYLNAGDTYTFLFWADSDTNGTDPTDLKNVAYNNNGETIAWAGKKETSWSADGVTAELKHVVARVTVHTTTAVALKEGNEFTCTVPTTYTTYNVYSEEVSGNSTGYTYTDGSSSVTSDEGGDLCHFYVLVGANDDNRTLTLRYNGELGNPAVRVDNVPLKPNCHTTLTGDVANLGLTNSTITATLSTDWGSTETLIEGLEIDENGTYIVSTAAALQAWAAAVASDPGTRTNCTLAADIDMTGQEWAPVCSMASAGYRLIYYGTFDGAGHTISNLKISIEDNNYVGFIGNLSGTVKNLKLTNASITSSGSQTGGIVGHNTGTLSGCSFEGTVSSSGSYTGGIAGRNTGILSGCSSSGEVTGDRYAGGIVGYTQQSGSVIACYSTASVEKATYAAGGIVGGLADSPTVLACYYSTGTVNNTASNYGSIVGYIYGSTITTCYSSVTASDGRGDSGTQVTDNDWSSAMTAMNTALSDTGWQYETGSEDFPLVITIR